ncbi:MAG: MerR family DNA-binding transcriptional regulator [Hyphomicrobiaceae bacterium]|nr:MerR family DNA-binding transcriptional regulator [Hyphomicrobiaceae bacterium]MCC0024102.1 MerR family DNA-binding transcriptional regulator [Hyphomicrobiaceae bacterium]
MPNSDAPLYSIAELAREFSISTRTIRFYEAKGLIAPNRVGGTRVFSKRDRARLMLILRGKRLGFSLREISDYLGLYDADPLQKSQSELLLNLVSQRLDKLEQQQRDLTTTIRELRDIQKQAETRLAEAGSKARRA